METTTMTSKGQIVIPAHIRDHLGLKKGIKLCISEKGRTLIIQPLTQDYFEQMAGVLPSNGQLTKTLLKERHKDKTKENQK